MLSTLSNRNFHTRSIYEPSIKLRPKRAPLISFKEIAERYEITTYELAVDFSNSKVPTPEMQILTSKRWYNLKEVIAWRKAFEAEKNIKE